MTTLIFVAAARGAQGSGYTARIHDLPNAAIEAPDMAGLLARAREAITDELQRLADEGQAWPVPTAIEQASHEPGAIPFLVDVVVEDSAVRVNISMGERLLKRMDQAAEAAGMSRSGYIAAAVRAALGERPTKRAIDDLDAVAKGLQEEWSQLGRKLADNLGPNSAFERKMTEFDTRVSETIRKTAETISAAMARRVDPEGRTPPPAERPAADAPQDPTGPVN